MKFLYLIILASIFMYPALAQSEYQQVLQSDQGTINVGFSVIPEKPVEGETVKLKIDFLNPKTESVQEHIDYKVLVTKDGENIFGPISLTHTSTGSVTIPVQLQDYGNYKVGIDIEGILFQPIPLEIVSFDINVEQKPTTPDNDSQKGNGGGCLIATATYGSELSPQIQQLREIRDNVILKTNSGVAFMNTFNQFYYSFSPTVADWERENPVLKETVKLAITPLITTLSMLDNVEMNSEEEVLGYGISLIILNVGMYFVIPFIAIIKIKRIHFPFSSNQSR